ncbi:MAG: hypothetical protein AB7S26_20070 [Sandaracinaceae bacterium]
MGRALVRASLMAALAISSGAGCSGSSDDARELRTAAEPFLEPHGRFDRWAERIALGDSGFRTEASRAETAFAPLTEEPRAVCAWIVREGPDPSELRYPAGAPAAPTEGWTRLSADDDALSAQARTIEIGGTARNVTLVRRTHPVVGGATLHVIVGFAPSDSAHSP